MSNKEIIEKIEQYVQSEIDSYTKEYREHWKDIKKIINGDTNLYAYWNLE